MEDHVEKGEPCIVVIIIILLLVFGVSFHSVLRPLESLARCTSPLQPKVTRTSLWLLRTAKE